MSTIGTVQTFRSKPRKVEAIQFTGRNGRQISELIKAQVEKTGFKQSIRNYGRYMKFTDGTDEVHTVRVGDFLLISDEYGYAVHYEKDVFEYEYSIGKNHAVL